MDWWCEAVWRLGIYFQSNLIEVSSGLSGSNLFLTSQIGSNRLNSLTGKNLMAMVTFEHFQAPRYG
jgi:hypothetical protein